MTLGDGIVLVALGLVCFLIVRSVLRNRKKGGCSCGCEACEKRDLCHPKK